MVGDRQVSASKEYSLAVLIPGKTVVSNTFIFSAFYLSVTAGPPLFTSLVDLFSLQLVRASCWTLPLRISTSFISLKASQVINKNYSLLRIYLVPGIALSILYYNSIGLYKSSVRMILYYSYCL